MEILKFSEPPRRGGRSRANNKSGLMPLVSFGIAVLVLGGMSTTLAGTITLNTSGNVEFGQGIVTTAACDTSLKITPSTTFDTNTAGGTFFVNQIRIGGIGIAASDTTSATQLSEGCLGKTFTLRGYNSTGDELTFDQTSGAATSNYLRFKMMVDTAAATGAGQPTDYTFSTGAAKSGYWLAFTATDENADGNNTGVVTLTNFTLPATVTRFTLETSQ